MRRPGPNRMAYHDHRFPEISVADLEQKIARFGQLLHRFDTIKIEQHSKHLFKVHSQRMRKMPQAAPAAEISENFRTVKE